MVRWLSHNVIERRLRLDYPSMTSQSFVLDSRLSCLWEAVVAIHNIPLARRQTSLPAGMTTAKYVREQNKNSTYRHPYITGTEYEITRLYLNIKEVN